MDLTHGSRNWATSAPSALLLVLCLPAAVLAQEATCPPGRYVVVGQHLVDGGTPPANDTVQIGGVEALVGSGTCAPGRFRLKTRRGRRLVTARFRDCLYVRKAVVRARQTDCDTLDGVVRSRHNDPRRRTFLARRIPSFAPPDDAIVVGAAGGTYVHASGARLVVPPGALTDAAPARVGVTPIALAARQQIAETLGLVASEDLVPLRAYQVFVGPLGDPQAQPLAASLAVSVPDTASSVAGSLIHALSAPTFVDGQTDPRPVGLLYGGPAHRGDGTFEVTLAPSDAGPPPGLGTVMQVRPGVGTCTVTGVVTDASTVPAGGLLVTSAAFPTLAARTTTHGFYRLLVREGSHTVTATRGRASATATPTCDPALAPTLDGVDLIVGDRIDPNVPRISIVDPPADERLAATVRVIEGTVGTALVRSVRIETHAAGVPDPLVVEVPVVGHAFSGTALLIAGRRNTVIVTGSDGRLLGSAHRVLEVVVPDEEPELRAPRSAFLDGRTP
jgi:hypothetical protein